MFKLDFFSIDCLFKLYRVYGYSFSVNRQKKVLSLNNYAGELVMEIIGDEHGNLLIVTPKKEAIIAEEIRDIRMVSTSEKDLLFLGYRNTSGTESYLKIDEIDRVGD